MTRMHMVDDTIIMAAHPGSDESMLNDVAHEYVMKQYRLSRLEKPLHVQMSPTTWLVTSDPDELEAFELTHPCDRCTRAKIEAVELLREHPELRLAIANLRYVEEWPDETPTWK